MRTRFAVSSLAAISAFFPLVASAQDLTRTLVLISNLLNGVMWIFITLAIVVFFWGLIKYLFRMSDDDAHKGLSLMFWGVVAIFVMVSIWGIIRLMQNTLGVGNTRPILPEGIYYRP